MSAEPPSVRTRSVPATGARLFVLAGLLLLLFAGYLALVPLVVGTADGKVASCGKAFAPPQQALGKSLCGDANEIRQTQVALFGIAGLLVGASGFLIFGSERRMDRRVDVAPHRSDSVVG